MSGFMTWHLQSTCNLENNFLLKILYKPQNIKNGYDVHFSKHVMKKIVKKVRAQLDSIKTAF